MEKRESNLIIRINENEKVLIDNFFKSLEKKQATKINRSDFIRKIIIDNITSKNNTTLNEVGDNVIDIYNLLVENQSTIKTIKILVIRDLIFNKKIAKKQYGNDEIDLIIKEVLKEEEKQKETEITNNKKEEM
ncbi:MAG: hypothetical protein Ta2D_07710 [Rickettsiales bacterium]|nr:MAG: hypothetical protein Ta2D_07710 [Rickettsiales bacterium]